MGKVTTKRVISELRKLKKELDVETMFLFGSRARGDELLTSDVDIIVVSKKFAHIPFRKRPDPFLDAWMLPVDLEIICYSPAELKRKQKEIGLVQEAMKQAVVV
ncbi:nucleotidyltransferase domain-containing protein [Candidatus Woesearchaeota archaeon]|nr:nucleotidyltransferase domain-containing protein [Candidatus Woesearchaeota archaeon]